MFQKLNSNLFQKSRVFLGTLARRDGIDLPPAQLNPAVPRMLQHSVYEPPSPLSQAAPGNPPTVSAAMPGGTSSPGPDL